MVKITIAFLVAVAIVVWLVVDVISCGLYLYKDLYFTSFLYGLYAVIAFGGYLRWKQLMNVTE